MELVPSLRHGFFPHFVLPHFYTAFVFLSRFILKLQKYDM